MARRTRPTTGSLACPPRFGTPRNPDRPTLGGEVGEVARRLGTPLMPWQQHVADVAYEYDPDTGLFFYDEVDCAVPRQSGKTTLIKARTVHRLVVAPARWGPQTSLYTAQSRLKARAKLERDFAKALRAARGSFRETPHSRARPQRPHEWRLSLNNGNEHIEFGTSSYWLIDAPSRTGAHGDTLDDAVIDEAFAHEDGELEGGVRPTQATRFNAQFAVISTAGDRRSKYWYRKVLAGRAACETGRHGRTASFEWSAPDDADPGDPDVWRLCSPALGFTIRLAFLQAEWDKAVREGEEAINTFRRAYLNQWPEVPVLEDTAGWLVVPEVHWQVCGDAAHKPAGPLRYALDVDTNAKGETWATVAASDGTHVEIVWQGASDPQPGTAWVVPACKTKRDEIGELVVARDGPAGKLITPLRRAGVKVQEANSRDVADASQQLLDAVLEHTIRHIDQAVLTTAAAGAERKDVGDGAWRWSRTRSAADIGPVIAASLARWAAATAAAPAQFFAAWA